MSELDGFFIVEEYGGVEVDQVETAAGTIVIPTKTEDARGKAVDRRPIDPGFVLGWAEWAADAPTVRWRRRGMVLACGPSAKSVWVIPDEQRPGEGGHVLVRGVVADPDPKAEEQPHRIVGGPGDYRSTPAWQSPRTMLPRPVLRADGCLDSAGAMWNVLRFLHADPACPYPPAWRGERIERGEPVPVESCYLFEGALHPMSERPIQSDGQWVPLCMHCMRSKLPD